MTAHSSSIRLPPPVRPGDRVGVAALSGPVDAERLEAGLAAVRASGFEPVLAENVTAERHLHFAGRDEERLEAFHRLAADPALPAIFFARGGYGVTRILDRLDWSLLERHPRAYVGYSDLTPFLDQVASRLGVAAFHGPMVAADWARGLSDEEERSLLGALAGDLPLAMPLTGWLRGVPAPARAVRGRLVGGCLSMLVATLGTEAAPNLDGSILVLEDVNEPLYRLDRMLTQLRLSGLLADLAGLVLGHFDGTGTGADEAGNDPLAESPLQEMLTEVLAPFDWPIALGLPCGHSPPNFTVPMGLQGVLEENANQLLVELP